MKLLNLQLLSGLSLSSPFQFFSEDDFIEDIDITSDEESELDIAEDLSCGDENVSGKSQSPHLPDLVMSTQRVGPIKTYVMKGKVSAEGSSPMELLRNSSSKPDPASQAVVVKSSVKEKQATATPKVRPASTRLQTHKAPEPNPAENQELKPKKNVNIDKNYTPKVADSKFLAESLAFCSDRSKRKRVRPKRFQEAFDELESLAKKFKAEEETKSSEDSEQENEYLASEEEVQSEEEESDHGDLEDESREKTGPFQPKVVLNRMNFYGVDKKTPEAASAKGLKSGYFCDRCRKMFRARSDLDRHQATIMCICRCVECQISFKNESYLQSHFDTEHRPLALLRKTLVEEAAKSNVKTQKEPANAAKNTKTPAKSKSAESASKTPKPKAVEPSMKTPSLRSIPAREASKTPAILKQRKVDHLNAPRKCCVVSCPKIPGTAKYLCTFPKEPDLSKKWEDKIERSNKTPLTSMDMYVCSKHFREELYMGSGLLKPGSVPSIFSDPKKRRSEVDIDEV